MKSLQELGAAIAERRRQLGLAQGDVAARAGVTQANLSRLERGRCSEFGSRKLLAVLATLGMQIRLVEAGASGSLDELRIERAGQAP